MHGVNTSLTCFTAPRPWSWVCLFTLQIPPAEQVPELIFSATSSRLIDLSTSHGTDDLVRVRFQQQVLWSATAYRTCSLDLDILPIGVGIETTSNMSSGPVEPYEGVTGVANDGGNPLLEDLNRYYSVRHHHAIL